MHDIFQAETHMTNTNLYRMADENPILETNCERQLQFIRHCRRMPKDEQANIYVLYQSTIRRESRRHIS